LATFQNYLAFADDGLDLRVPEYFDLRVGNGALSAIWVEAEVIFLVLLVRVLIIGSSLIVAMKDVFRCCRVWEVLRMKCAQIILRK
jgi:hypothetical protein